MKAMNEYKPQAGFTLIELALVMVIIGVLLGGTIKGQQLIENARLNRVLRDVDTIKAAYFTYLERYRVLPGDDAQAKVHLGLNSLENGNGNGQINGEFIAQGSVESQLAWQHLGAAELIDGGQPVHPWGGLLGFSSGSFGMSGTSVCLQDLDAKVARILDIKNDDGSANAGRVRGGLRSSTVTAAASYANDQRYHLCFKV